MCPASSTSFGLAFQWFWQDPRRWALVLGVLLFLGLYARAGVGAVRRHPAINRRVIGWLLLVTSLTGLLVGVVLLFLVEPYVLDDINAQLLAVSHLPDLGPPTTVCLVALSQRQTEIGRLSGVGFWVLLAGCALSFIFSSMYPLGRNATYLPLHRPVP